MEGKGGDEGNVVKGDVSCEGLKTAKALLVHSVSDGEVGFVGVVRWAMGALRALMTFSSVRERERRSCSRRRVWSSRLLAAMLVRDASTGTYREGQRLCEKTTMILINIKA